MNSPPNVESQHELPLRGDGVPMTKFRDDDLVHFAAAGAQPLPHTDTRGHIEHDGAKIWYASFGAGEPVILLHGGLGHGGNWGYQVPALVEHGYQVIVIDSRGHGRSTRDSKPYSYDLMSSDVLAVMDVLKIEKASFVGWSDGAVTALVLAKNSQARVSRVFFFACNVDASGTKDFELTSVVERCFKRNAEDYAMLSVTPNDFDDFVGAVGKMQSTQPNYQTDDLAKIQIPVTSALSETDEFIKIEHAKYIAATIPDAAFVELHGVSHFAPVQRPQEFSEVLLDFLSGKPTRRLKD
jgi:pimeloyl-ACP methyl ester carboxylesterase